MKYLILSLVSLAFLAQELRAVGSEQAVGLEFIAADGFTHARVFLSSDSLLLDYPVQRRGYLFREDSYLHLNRSDKTYTIHSYSDLLSIIPRKVNSDASGSASSDLSAAGLESTGESEMIAGVTASKIVRMSGGTIGTEIWVSRELTPNPLQTLGNQMRAVVPTNLWADNKASPKLFLALVVFGLPLRIVEHESGSEIRAVPMDSKNIPDDWFRVPSDYKQRGL